MATDIILNDDDNEREAKVLDLYTQGKSTRDIAKIMRMSLRDVGPIIKSDKELKETEMDNSDGNDSGNGKVEQNHQYQTISLPAVPRVTAAQLEELSDNQKAAIAYKLYDQGKTPVQVATTLCVSANKVIGHYRDFWKLKCHYQLYQIYPEIQHSLPSFVKLFKELKKQGLNSQNVKWFVDGLNIGTIKIEGVYTDFENAKKNYANLLNEKENLRNENQGLRRENQDIVNGIHYNRRMFENESKAMQKHITDLSKVQEQQQHNVDTLSERIFNLYNKEQE